MAIKVEQLTKVYGTQKAVDSISFEIFPGEIVGFLGPNGAGKSTTMKMLTTYIKPTAGKASVAGFDLENDSMEIRRNVGYLPESNPLYFEMYVREYLHFTAKIHQLSNPKSRIDEVIERTGLTKEVHKKIGTLSKGYKQRVGIAQAIIHDPKVLILDEPTSGLDPNQLADIRQLILDIGKEKSVMLSTHIMQEVEAMCRRAIIINDGKIVKQIDLQQESSEVRAQQTLQVVFSAAIDTQNLNKALPKDTIIKSLSTTEILLSTADAAALRKALMRHALEQDIEITKLQEHVDDLETIFRAATKK